MMVKEFKKASVVVVIAILSFFYLAQLDVAEASSSSRNVKNVSIKSAKSTIYMGGYTTTTTKVTMEKKSRKKASSMKKAYTSSNTRIAKVDSKGKVTGLAEGTVTISVKAERKVGKVTIKVLPNVKSVKLVQQTPLFLGSSSSLTTYVTMNPDSYKKLRDFKVSYLSSNPRVATVDAYGKVTAKMEGTVIISARAEKKEGKLTIKVLPNVTNLSLVKTSPLLIGEKSEVKAALSLAQNSKKKSSDFKVTYSTSNPKVATVDPYGKLTGVTAGPVTITAKAENKMAKLTFNVESHLSSFSFSKKKDLLDIGEVFASETSIVMNPNSAKQLSDLTVTYASSNPSVATVNDQGEITGIAEGTAIITAKALDKVATMTVTVSPIIWSTGPFVFYTANNMTWASDASKLSVNNEIINASNGKTIKVYDDMVDFYSQGLAVLNAEQGYLNVFTNGFKPVTTITDLMTSGLGADPSKYSHTYSRDGSYLLYSLIWRYDAKYLVNLKTNQLERILKSPESYVELDHLDMHPSGEKAAVIGGNLIYIYDLKTGAIETNYFDRQVKDVLYSPDGNQLASLNEEDYEVKIWDVNAEDIQYQLNQHQGPVNDFAYSSDGTYFATAGDDGKIIIYDVKNQYRVVRTLMTNEDKKRERLGWPTDKVKVISFNPSGTALSALHETSFNQATLRLWNLNGL